MGLNPIEMWDGYGPFQELFQLYLFVIFCICFVRMFRVACGVWSFRRKRESLCDEKINIEAAAKTAMKGRLETEGIRETINNSAVLLKADRIETRFVYLWETCYAKVRSTKTLVLLTVILTLLMAVSDAVNMCRAIKLEESVGASAIAGGWLDFLEIMTAGLIISAFFYAFSSWFESILFRRRRDWYYFKAKLKEELSPNTSHGTK